MDELAMAILTHIKNEQGGGERAQVSTQILAETLVETHGDVSVARVRSILSDLIDKGLVQFFSQMGGFQIVMCALTPAGKGVLAGGPMPAARPVSAPPAFATSPVRGTLAPPPVHKGPDWVSRATKASGSLPQDEQAEVLAALELLQGSPNRGRLLCALRSLKAVALPKGLVSVQELDALTP